MKKTWTCILIGFAIFLSFESFGQKTISSQDLESIKGEWTGTLTYIDYSSNKPYTMPANLIVESGRNENHLLLFNIYPDEPKANDKDKMILSKDGKRINGKDVKSRQMLSNGQVQITVEYVGKDNRKKVLIRNIYELGEKQFVIRKEVQDANTKEWKRRSEFSYKR